LEPIKVRYGPRSSTYALEVELAERLRTMTEPSLELAAEDLGLDLTGWVRGTDKPMVLARKALESELDALAKFANSVARLSGRETGLFIYDRAVPYAWVNAEAAARIVDIATRQTGRAAGLNSDEQQTCRMYVRRARHDWTARTMTGGWSESVLDEVVDDARRVLAKVLSIDANTELKDLNLYLAEGQFFLIVPAPLPDAETASRLVEAFPSVTFLFLAGAMSYEEFTTRGLDNVEYLRPELDPEREAAVLRRYTVFRGQLDAMDD
jgi:hypothetical protein